MFPCPEVHFCADTFPSASSERCVFAVNGRLNSDVVLMAITVEAADDEHVFTGFEVFHAE